MSAPMSVRFRLALESFRENLNLVLKSWSGKIGIALLIIQAILALYAVAAYYPTGEMKAYMSSSIWTYEYPRNAPPCWVVKEKAEYFKLGPDAFTSNMTIKKKTIQIGFVYKYNVYTITTMYTASFTYNTKVLPQDLRLLVDLGIVKPQPPQGVKPHVPPKLKVSLYIERPDGRIAELYNGTLPINATNILMAGANISNQLYPIRLGELQEETPNAYDVEGSFIIKSIGDLLEEFNTNTSKQLKGEYGLLILATPDENGNAVALQGTYRVVLKVVEILDGAYYENGYKINVTIKDFDLESIPNCYGLLGTDPKARPIGLGLLLGLPYAFLLGFIVTFTSTFIGAVYGTFAGYWKDYRGEAMMRVADVFLSLPFLPILIALSYVFKSVINLWMLSFLMIILFWAGPVIVVRSMALQISEQTYVEAAKAVGASTWRIVFRHIFPQVFPYTLAIAVLSIPGIIIAEASLSLLGLGDPTAPTWGKLLQEAYDAHAVQNGLWWLYIFPGLALVVFSATFLLIGRAVEPLVAPKLQR